MVVLAMHCINSDTTKKRVKIHKTLDANMLQNISEKQLRMGSIIHIHENEFDMKNRIQEKDLYHTIRIEQYLENEK